VRTTLCVLGDAHDHLCYVRSQTSSPTPVVRAGRDLCEGCGTEPVSARARVCVTFYAGEFDSRVIGGGESDNQREPEQIQSARCDAVVVDVCVCTVLLSNLWCLCVMCST
jgi:hypothetical protein